MPNTTTILALTLPHARARASLALLMAAGLAIALASGCSTGADAESTSANAPLSAKPADDQRARSELAEAIARDADALSKLLRDGPEREPAAPPVAASPVPRPAKAAKPAPAEPAAPPAANISTAMDTGAETAVVVGAASTEPPVTLDQRIERLAVELATRLRDKTDRNVAPLHSMIGLANLEYLAPGAFDPAAGATLTPAEAQTLAQWRDLLRRMGADLAKGADGSAVARAVRDAADSMSGQQTISVSTVALCSRVEGFGRYTTLPSSSLLAGRKHRAIVYTEVDHFGSRPAAGPEGEAGFSVDLTQDISLFHDADGVLAWRRPEQDISDFSRNRRRDFFVVQMIDLPETLSIGAYRLKITMRDRSTNAVAEAIVPIEVVADPGVVSQRADRSR